MRIRLSRPNDAPALLALWERAVRATHGFLTEEDIVFYRPLTAQYLGSGVQLWIMPGEDDAPIGFMAVTTGVIDALFVDPAHHRRGVGTRLVAHAQALHGGALTVDVNEENAAAREFYAALGFDVSGRSPVDDTGRPHPLLHLRRGR